MPPAKPFQKGNPGGPGRPPIPDPVLEAGVPTDLAAVRAAAHWEHSKLPKHPLVRVAVRAKLKNPERFMAQWTKLEESFRARTGGGASGPGSGTPAQGSSERVEDAVGERVVEDIEAWLEKHRLAAVARAEAIERGERA
jgi:hypothetical protein